MYKNKKTNIAGIIITIILLIALVMFTNVDITKFSYTESVFNKVVMQIQNGLTYLKHKMAGNSVFFADINDLKDENEKLKEEKKVLEENLRELEAIKAENSILREYSNMTEKYTEYTTIPAYIIDKDITNLSNTIIINAGTDSGVSANMAVISSSGLVRICCIINK